METKFRPNYAIHPGVILKEDLDALGISQKSLSLKIGVSASTINEIIKGKRAINARFAILLEDILPYKANYWMGLQGFYEETLARLELEKERAVAFEITNQTLFVDQSYYLFKEEDCFLEMAYCLAS